MDYCLAVCIIKNVVLDIDLTLRSMRRLNSGTMNHNNFFIQTNFSCLILGIDSVDNAESGNIKVLVVFPGNNILAKGMPTYIYAHANV